MPERLQRSRARGWRMPVGAVYVGRPSPWGNPFVAGEPMPWPRLRHEPPPITPEDAVRLYRRELIRELQTSDYAVDLLVQLRGKDLVCWCPLDGPCHADVLLELANA